MKVTCNVEMSVELVDDLGYVLFESPVVKAEDSEEGDSWHDVLNDAYDNCDRACEVDEAHLVVSSDEDAVTLARFKRVALKSGKVHWKVL